ncbi:MAG: hypothetical protein QOI22_922 [Verrucomicrobiota bacterium]|jgi:hypothetical protein
MSWFQANRWLGRFLIGLGIATLLASWFLFHAKRSFGEAKANFEETAAEQNRLERRDPFPSETNYRKLKVHIENYAAALEKFKEELKGHVLPSAPLAPNEFQSRLRQAMVASAEKARANKVKLPDNFALGFNEFTAALPNNDIAHLLAQELARAEVLTNILIEARVDRVTAFARRPVAPSPVAAAMAPGKKPTSSPASEPKMIERNIVDLTFVAGPSAARRALNQMASSNQQLFVIRTLHVRNEKERGPPREGDAAGTAVTTNAVAAALPPSNAALNFIVGNEQIETSVRIEMVRLTF